jgi:hypothetical protein
VKACLFYFFTMNAYMHFLMPFIVNVAWIIIAVYLPLIALIQYI